MITLQMMPLHSTAAAPGRTVLQRTFKRIEGITPQKYMEDLEANSSTHSSKA